MTTRQPSRSDSSKDLARKKKRATQLSQSGLAPGESMDNEDGHLKFREGLVLNSRYSMIRKLGEGTFGRVFECSDSDDGGRKKAVKVVRAVERYKHDAMVEASVLDELAQLDPKNECQCVRIQDRGEAYGHYMLIFEALGPSLAEELEMRNYNPFSMRRIRTFGRDMLNAISFMHRNDLIHTDLKLPNVLLELDTRDCTRIKVIDFGGTRRTSAGRRHKSLVQTRQYRAPEVLLEYGWSFPADLWSIGCMLLELYTSDLLFPVHHTDEHLALIQHVCGTIPQKMAPAESQYFTKEGQLKDPNCFPPTKARHVRHRQTLKEIVRPRDAEFYDVVKQMLRVDPEQRITARDALRHPFFSEMAGKGSTTARTVVAATARSIASSLPARPNTAEVPVKAG
jgi:serine/threonine protein kinase